MPSSQSDLLRGCAFVDGLPDQHLWHLARAGALQEFPPDHVLFAQGDERKLMAIIVEGGVAIEKGSEGGITIRMTTLGPGEAVGEGILLDDAKHGTTARVIQPTKAFVYERAKLGQLLKDQPAIYAALVGRAARAISQRLSRVDATMTGRGRALGFGGQRTRLEKDLLG